MPEQIGREAREEASDHPINEEAAALANRIAADILSRFAEELNSGGDYAGAQHAPLDMEGLSARPGSLDAALTDLRLLALVVGVEGPTEYKLVPKVLDLLEIQWCRNRIEIVNFGGTETSALGPRRGQAQCGLAHRSRALKRRIEGCCHSTGASGALEAQVVLAVRKNRHRDC